MSRLAAQIRTEVRLVSRNGEQLLLTLGIPVLLLVFFSLVDLAIRSGLTYVLHAFQKKTPKTRQEDIDTARTRYAQAKEAEK